VVAMLWRFTPYNHVQCRRTPQTPHDAVQHHTLSYYARGGFLVKGACLVDDLLRLVDCECTRQALGESATTQG